MRYSILCNKNAQENIAWVTVEWFRVKKRNFGVTENLELDRTLLIYILLILNAFILLSSKQTYKFMFCLQKKIFAKTLEYFLQNKRIVVSILRFTINKV